MKVFEDMIMLVAINVVLGLPLIVLSISISFVMHPNERLTPPLAHQSCTEVLKAPDCNGGRIYLTHHLVPHHHTGSVKYLWPIQQPVSDLDTQRKRLTAIREELGYRLVGCDLIECFQ